jgi:acetyltransferase-like isoleucine patch superfamily enzyme
MISKNAILETNDLQIGKNVVIGDNVEIRCPEKIHIGDNSVLTKNIKINCTSFEAGEYLFMCDRVEIGRGGCYGPNSRVKIGKHVGIFEGTVINPSEEVEIGDDTGIGGEVMIWTHGAWLDILQGFPADFGPVKIGSNVWLPARSVVLPHVTIGNDVVIGINSIINRSLPNGCFAAGSPCKVIKENVYPKKLSQDEKTDIVEGIIKDWLVLCEMKGITRTIKIRYERGNLPLESGKIFLNQGYNETIYNIEERKIEGYMNNVAEDLRDYLRRRGIKIYTGKPFKSIKL